MAIEVSVHVNDCVIIAVSTDAPYSPDVAEDLIRRTGEAAVAAYVSLPDDEDAGRT